MKYSLMASRIPPKMAKGKDLNNTAPSANPENRHAMIPMVTGGPPSLSRKPNFESSKNAAARTPHEKNHTNSPSSSPAIRRINICKYGKRFKAEVTGRLNSWANPRFDAF